MMFWKVALLSTIVLSLFGRTLSAILAVGDDCTDTVNDSCGTGLVCETAGGSSLCKVKADGTQTDCADTAANCPADSTCSATDGTCSCDTGFKVLSTGLCTDVIGSTCENNAACSSVLANSECEIISPCTKGVCVCSSGYYGTDCLGLGNGKTCTSGADKCFTTIGLHCTAGLTCGCSDSALTYRTELGLCTDKKILGEACDANSDCYASGSNAECDTTCKCSAGYYKDGQTCRRPYAGATCTDTCAKVPTISLLSGGESSQQTPTCATTNNKCDCDSDETVSRKIGDTCYTVCLSAYAGTAKAAGVECAAFHECESKVCAQCPDDANPKCYNAPCSGSTISGSILVSSIILLSILF